nr:class A beta-lactamase [uncultured bacterium]
MKSRNLLTKTIVSGLLLFQFLSVSASDLSSDIQEVIKGKKAQVGVAVLYKDDAVTMNNDGQYPLMSVFKFHIALAVLKKMQQEGILLSAVVTLGPSDIDTKTWSPMYKKYKSEEITLSYGDLINYMVSQSDNNACNWLINFVGGIQNVNAFIKDLGIDQIQLIETEKSMEQDIRKSYNNWSTPLSVVQLLRKVYTEKVLSDEQFAFLEKAMLASVSGKDKFRAGLPKEIEVGHKTGMSYRTPEGVRMCDADVGVIYMPGGEKCYLAVLVKDSKESDAANAKIMADIAKKLYEHYTENSAKDAAPVK